LMARLNNKSGQLFRSKLEMLGTLGSVGTVTPAW